MIIPPDIVRGGPAALFLHLWGQAALWNHVERHDATLPPAGLTDELTAVLMDHDAPEPATAALIAELVVAGATDVADEERGHLLAAMQAIDDVFLRIHPRTRLLPPARAPRVRLPAWLEAQQDERTVHGFYALDAHRRLLPRGPFTARARTLIDLNGDTLEDRFSALTAAPLIVMDGERPIAIETCVVGHHALRGVPAGCPAGSEHIGIVPIAERAAELDVERLNRPARPHVKINLRSEVPAADRLFAGVRRMGSLDIAVAPELTMSETQSRLYAELLSAAATAFPRLSIAGSGQSDQADHKDRRRNQSIAYNSAGTELWRHSKIWPYGMDAGQVAKFRWPPAEAGCLLMEEVAPGDSLTVADIDGLGRVITLICQDVQIAPAVSEAIRVYQPDWVVVPILDDGVDLVRWPHVRAFALSGTSRARFIVASSLSLAEQAGVAAFDKMPVGVLVGPQSPDAGAGGAPRAVGVIRCTHDNPKCGSVTWGDGSAAWSQTNIARPQSTDC